MKYLRKFSTTVEMETTLANSTIGIVGLAYDNSTPVINLKPTPPPDPKTQPFYIDVRGSVTLAATSGLQMSTDGENWTDTAAMELPTGKTYFRVAEGQTKQLIPNWTENSTSDYDIGGNINSLVKTDFVEDTTGYNFYNYFKDKTKLKSAGNLILPGTTLAYNCYANMFQNCTSLTTAPVLSATTLANNCYAAMFNGCTSLTTAPVLPATSLYANCYQAMFSGCTALTTAPELPATTLAKTCYQEMFSGCTNLNYIKCLATNKSATDCTYIWVSGVASTGTFVKAASMSQSTWGTGTSGIPSGWTVQDATTE